MEVLWLRTILLAFKGLFTVSTCTGNCYSLCTPAVWKAHYIHCPSLPPPLFFSHNGKKRRKSFLDEKFRTGINNTGKNYFFLLWKSFRVTTICFLLLPWKRDLDWIRIFTLTIAVFSAINILIAENVALKFTFICYCKLYFFSLSFMHAANTHFKFQESD